MKRPPVSGIRLITVLCCLALLTGCQSLKQRRQVSLGEIYDDLAKLPDTERNPVIVIPGILGSRSVSYTHLTLPTILLV